MVPAPRAIATSLVGGSRRGRGAAFPQCAEIHLGRRAYFRTVPAPTDGKSAWGAAGWNSAVAPRPTDGSSGVADFGAGVAARFPACVPRGRALRAGCVVAGRSSADSGNCCRNAGSPAFGADWSRYASAPKARLVPAKRTSKAHIGNRATVIRPVTPLRTRSSRPNTTPMSFLPSYINPRGKMAHGDVD